MAGKSKVNVLIVLLCLFSTSYCLWSDIVYTASLSISQVVPTPNDPPYVSGNAICIYTQSDEAPTLNCKVQHDVTVITGIQIGFAPRNNFGTTQFNFSSSPFSAYAEETFTFVNTSDYQLDSQINDFLNGLWYIQLISDDYPTGILRGQLEHTSRGYSLMSVANTVPRASGSTATGIALIDFSFYDPDRFLQVDIVNNIATPTGTEIRYGLPGQSGALVYEFDTTFSPQFDSVTLTVSEEVDFLDDLYYLNILSKINPSGEIRGQLTTIDYANNIGFTSRLAGVSEDTNNLGCAIVGYNCFTRVVEMLIMHDIPDANGGYIAASNSQQDQIIPIFSLPSSQSPIFVSQKLTPQQAYYLFSQVLTITITSPDFPQGEITGEISVKYDFYAYLSGSNIVPPVTTSAVGCVTLSLDKNNQLDYSIFHTVKSAVEVNLNYGNEGQNGVVASVFPAVASPVRGTTFELGNNELQALIYEQIYIGVNSEDYPFLGEIRGQIKRVAPCSVSEDQHFSVVQTSLNQNGGNYGGGAVTSSASSLYFPVFSFIAVVLSFFVFSI